MNRKCVTCHSCFKCEHCIRRSERRKLYRKIKKVLDAYAKLHGETTPVSVRLIRMEMKAIRMGRK